MNNIDIDELRAWIDQRASDAPQPMEQGCPRQAEATVGVQLAHQPTWRDENDGWKTCSYCGSLSPESFWRAIRAEMELGPTDKNYKVYVKAADVRGAGKLYFQHLPDDDKIRFIDAINAGILRFGYPGHFYRLPYFIAPANPSRS